MKLEKLLLLVLLISTNGIGGCSWFHEEEDSPDFEIGEVCGVSNPLKNLPWLNKHFQDVNKYSGGIVLYEYKGQQIIEIQTAVMSSTNRSQYYCDGTRLVFDTVETIENYKHFRENATKIKVLWGGDLWGDLHGDGG